MVTFLCSLYIVVVGRNNVVRFIVSLTRACNRIASVQACGAKHRIQGEFLDETNVDDVVVALVSLAAQVSFVFG